MSLRFRVAALQLTNICIYLQSFSAVRGASRLYLTYFESLGPSFRIGPVLPPCIPCPSRLSLPLTQPSPFCSHLGAEVALMGFYFQSFDMTLRLQAVPQPVHIYCMTSSDLILWPDLLLCSDSGK